MQQNLVLQTYLFCPVSLDYFKWKKFNCKFIFFFFILIIFSFKILRLLQFNSVSIIVSSSTPPTHFHHHHHTNIPPYQSTHHELGKLMFVCLSRFGQEACGRARQDKRRALYCWAKNIMEGHTGRLPHICVHQSKRKCQKIRQ